MTARTLPTEPGWWWVQFDGRAPVVAYVGRSMLSSDLVARYASRAYGFDVAVPIAPVATPDDVTTMRAEIARLTAALRGAVPAETHARAVRDAYSLGITTCAAALHVPESRLNGARGTWVYSAAAKGAVRTLTAAGLSPDEAAAVVAGVSR